MQKTSKVIHSLEISAPAETMMRFSTLLQSGITLYGQTMQSIGLFLENLPGFSIDYLSDRVQTIFIDGDAVDNLERQFSKTKHVIALSAAMPGLAGAIFRRHSLCAALRTAASATGSETEHGKQCEVQLKLFNVIAQEKGSLILQQGGEFQGHVLIEFMMSRQTLVESITSLSLDGKALPHKYLLNSLHPDSTYHVTITDAKA